MGTGKRATAGAWSRERGYTYLLVLFLVAGLGLFAAQAGVVWQAATQREREAELLAVGSEMAGAIAAYRDATPAGRPAWPTTLQQLVEDKRFPTPRRHLRRIYRDPLTGRAEWGLVREGDAIVGIHSLSNLAPIRRHELSPALDDAAKSATRYSEWIFRPAVQGGASAGAAVGGRGAAPQ
jgi:type II secretory pathway pseudopilin PulG